MALDPRLDPALAAMPRQVNWNLAQAPGAAALWYAPPAPDLAKENREAAAADAQSAAAAKAAAGGIQNQKDEDLASAVLALQGQSPKQAALMRQVKAADAIRQRGAALNTGSVNGSAPNWAGALAEV